MSSGESTEKGDFVMMILQIGVLMLSFLFMGRSRLRKPTK